MLPPNEEAVVMRQRIGGRLRNERQARGLSLRQVAAIASLSISHLSEIERGQKEPSFATMIAVARALELKLKVVL